MNLDELKKSLADMTVDEMRRVAAVLEPPLDLGNKTSPTSIAKAIQAHMDVEGAVLSRDPFASADPNPEELKSPPPAPQAEAPKGGLAGALAALKARLDDQERRIQILEDAKKAS